MERAGNGWGKAELFGVGMFATTTRDATLSPNGAYLFFSANNDLYWVSTELLDALRPRRRAVGGHHLE